MAAIALESDALEQWRQVLEGSWTSESVPRWKRAWRKAWTFMMTVG
jgi:hypothetical protein